MFSIGYGKILGRVCLVILMVTSAILLALPSGVVFASIRNSQAGPSILPAAAHPITVHGPPKGDKGPDDIAILAVGGLDGGIPLIWTNFQNGILPNGTAGTPGGPTQSTIAGYDPSTGSLVETIPVTGKVDGMTADPDHGRLIATVNEDANSAFNLVDPATSTVTAYTYSPSPEVSGNGGTDSIALSGGQIYVAHSNPNDVGQAADYSVTLDNSTHAANLTPLFYCNSTATDVTTGKTVQLGLTDPDTNFIMPSASPKFAGDLVQIGQGDGQLIFASLGAGTPVLNMFNVTDNVPGNTPPTDGLAVATADSGTLYVVDASGGTIQAFDTTGWPAGTVFIGEPKDVGNPLIGTLDLTTGKITRLGNLFNSPKGLLFVPAQSQVMTTSSTTAPSTTSSSSTGTSFPIPGFPVESIIVGLVIGLASLFALKRSRK